MPFYKVCPLRLFAPGSPFLKIFSCTGGAVFAVRAGSISLCLLVCLSFSLCRAQVFQPIEIPSSPQPVGSGARALGMGGAFIAVCDDATAASWNPAGLIQLESREASLVLEGCHRIEDNHFEKSPGANGPQTVTRNRINYFSLAQPFRWKRRYMVVSLNYQHLYNFNRKWNLTLNRDQGGTDAQYLDFQSEGALHALGLALGFQISPSLSLGITLNHWDENFNDWEEKRYQEGYGTDEGEEFGFQSYIKDTYSLKGQNLNLGALWNAYGDLYLAIVIKTPFSADIFHTKKTATALWYPGLPGFGDHTEDVTVENAVLDMPLSCGLGVSYQVSNSFTLAGDIYLTRWEDFILTDGKGNQTSPVTGRPEESSDISSTVSFRMGAEYNFTRKNKIFPLRMGAFYDPAPADGKNDDYYGISLGTGMETQKILFDLAWVMRFGNDVGSSLLSAYGLRQDVEEHSVYASVIVYF